MYNSDLQNSIITDLESREIQLVELVDTLASQGYVVNRSKLTKLSWIIITLHAFENIDVFDDEQQSAIERIYNKIQTL